MPSIAMLHEEDPRDVLMREVGDISGVEVFANDVLCAIYRRPKVTRGGIYVPDQHLEEDRFQGKAMLILKMGSMAFQDTDRLIWPEDMKCKVGDWIYIRPSDGWALTLNTLRGSSLSKDDCIDCRIVEDTRIRGRVTHPDMIY